MVYCMDDIQGPVRSDHKLDTNCKKNGFNYQRTSKEAENNWISNR